MFLQRKVNLQNQHQTYQYQTRYDYTLSRCGEIGRRATLRGWWGDPCQFESGHRHQIKIRSIIEKLWVFFLNFDFLLFTYLQATTLAIHY